MNTAATEKVNGDNLVGLFCVVITLCYVSFKAAEWVWGVL